MSAPANNNDRPLSEIARDLILHAEAVREDQTDMLGQLVNDLFGPRANPMRERRS